MGVWGNKTKMTDNSSGTAKEQPGAPVADTPSYKYAVLAGSGALVAVFILIVIKAYAYYTSGAASVLSSLIDSVVDAGMSLMALIAIFYAIKPADYEHRHGHGKAEGVSALFQAAFISGAAAFLLFESAQRFFSPVQIQDQMLASLIMGVSVIVSILLVILQRFSLSRTPSLALEADKMHYSSDIVVNIGVIAILGAHYYGAPDWVDPAFAALVAFILILTARTIALKALDMLLDREMPAPVREEIIQKVLLDEEVLGLHDLRTRRSGLQSFISFDMEVDANLPFARAHEISRRVEQDLLEAFPEAEIMIHLDPHGDTQDSRHRVEGVHH